MKSLRILSLVFVCFIIYYSSNCQIIFNPDNTNFEIAEEGKLPRGWYLTNAADKYGYVAFATKTNPKKGNYCLELSSVNIKNLKKQGNALQSIDAKLFKGRKIKFRAACRSEINDTSSTAWLSIDVVVNGADSTNPDNSKQMVINSKEWKYYEFNININKDAAIINYGILLNGIGKVWIDDVSLEVIDNDESSLVPPKQLEPNALANIEIFTKLMGYVRYFNPSTEVIKENWDKFALTGVDAVEDIRSTDKLIDKLNQLFKPLAPTISIFPTEKPKNLKNISKPTEALDNIAVAYEHRGPAVENSSILIDNEPVNIYHSLRGADGSVFQIVDAAKYLGKKLKFSAIAKANIVPPSGNAQLWVRVDLDANKQYISVNMDKNPIVENSWKKYSVEFDVPNNAKFIRLGLVLVGDGKVCFDDASLTVLDNDKETSIDISNPGFEQGETEKVVFGWKVFPASEKVGYSAKICSDSAVSGAKYLSIESDKESRVTFPNINDVLSKDLGNGVSFSMPLTLYVDSLQTLPYADKSISKVKSPKPDNFLLTAKDRTSRIATVAIIWNLFKNFNIFNRNTKSWDSILTITLNKAALDKNEHDFQETLSLLLASLNDDQARIWHSDVSYDYGLPFLWKLINNKLYITKTLPTEKDIVAGDEIISIDGKTPMQLIQEKLPKCSGNNLDWKYQKALAFIKVDSIPSTAVLEVKHNNSIQKYNYKRNSSLNELFEERPDDFSKVTKDIYYIDLSRINDKKLKDSLPRLSGSKGIIVDLRGTNKASEHFLGIFTNTQKDFAHIKIPIFTKPQDEFESYHVIKSIITKLPLRIYSKLAFLTDERTIGNTELIANFVKNNNLGTLIGSKTNGSPSEVVVFPIPCGYYISMSYIVPTDINGEKLIGKQIIPDVVVTRDLESEVSEKDEVLEKAIELLSK